MAAYWLLARPMPRAPGVMVTQAFVRCCACGRALDAVGGPRDAICDACLDRIENIQADMRERY
jgi:hypothetical protein